MISLRINRKYLKQFDWYTLLLLIAISLIGVMTIYSATRPTLSSIQPTYFLKQFIWTIIGIVLLVLTVIKDYLLLKKMAYFLYGFGLFLLVLVLVAGKSGMGAQRWLELGFFRFQPSELFRVMLIVGLSRYLSSVKGPLQKDNFFIALFLFGLLPAGLIVKQPHLGTSIIVLTTFCFMALSKKIEKKLLIVIIATLVIVIPFMIKPIWSHLKDYQKNRIVAFLDPARDPRGIGYQIEQSKITIGAGMLFGRGYLQGTQGPLRFLPEKHTDFIFSVFAEEWGFIGCSVLFLLYLLFFLQGLDTALKAKDEFGRHMALGITFMIFLYFLINIGMVLGMMPVVGVPIPFMSYGGTSIVTNFLAVGIIINIRMRRHVLFY